MEKVESPDYYQMDISENCTTEYNSDSVSPTISNLQTDNELNEEKSENSLSTKICDHESIINQNTYNLSINQQSTSSSTSILTPVSKHPLIFDSDESEEENGDVKLCRTKRNIPDVVLMTNNKNSQQQQKNHRSNINSVNNNDGKNRIIPKYREPSPVSS